MEVLIGASLVAAFIAGIAALFAPCCITVLLPAYFASIFKQKRTVFLMTFVFFLGLLTVFLPLGLGIGGLGQIFSKYHNILYIIGAVFLFFLGLSILLGIHFSLPISIKPGIKVDSAGSVYALGIFSAFATLCCAPVLAGVMALSILPGSLLLGGLYTLAYVLGMVAPLFVLAFTLDKTDAASRLSFLKKPFSYSIMRREVVLKFADLLSGVTFVVMGILISYLALTNKIAMKSSYQTMFNIFMANTTDKVAGYIGWVPPPFWIALIIAVFGLIFFVAYKLFKSQGGKKDA